MPPSSSSSQHWGEVKVQRIMKVPPGLNPYDFANSSMPQQHSDFYQNLNYFPIAVSSSSDPDPVSDSDSSDSNFNTAPPPIPSNLDNSFITNSPGPPGKPIHENTPPEVWVTFLSNCKITYEGNSTLLIQAICSPDDPVVLATTTKSKRKEEDLQLFAGVGVDFKNRRRNKVNGGILSAHYDTLSGVYSLKVKGRECMGNCPKYITVRQLEPFKRRIEPATKTLRKLDEESKEILGRASTVYLGSRHLDLELKENSDIGLNHRGGTPGFIRYYEEEGQGYVVIPDYSGNRYYQSLGNIETDRVAGLVICDFLEGSLVHISGRAENLFGWEAEVILPTVKLLTRITVREVVLIKGAVQLKMRGEEMFSPYNPPIKYLASETKVSTKRLNDPLLLTLTKVERNSKLIKTFTFTSKEPVNDFLPGGFGIFNFSGVLKREYQHMNNQHPSLINDDFIRTWTISKVSGDRRELSVTVKKAGFISGLLHSLDGGEGLPVVLDGFGGEFSCFTKEGEAGRILPKKEKMIWLAGGVGITPFLAMYQAMKMEEAKDVIMFFSCRGDEVNLLEEFQELSKITVFDSTSSTTSSGRNVNTSILNRRISEEDLRSIPDIAERTVYICGPETFMKFTSTVCEKLAKDVITENFTF